jgi:hypothetical protein
MANLILNGSTSGSVTLSSPAVSGTTTLTLPTTSGTVITTASGQTLTSPVIAGTTTGVGVLTSATAVASTAGTSITFTGIPSWVKRVTVMLQGVKNSASSNISFKLGTSGGIISTGYLGCTVQTGGSTTSPATNFSTEFKGQIANTSALYHGSIVFNNLNSNVWVCGGMLSLSNDVYATSINGSVDLGNILTQLQISTSAGAGTFTAGSINILYE